MEELVRKAISAGRRRNRSTGLVLCLLALVAASIPRSACAEALPSGVQFRNPAMPVFTLVPFNQSGIVIDGKIGETEWFAASAVTGFFDNTSRAFSSRQMVVYTCYDADNLYLAFQSEAPSDEGRDSIIVLLKPGLKEYVMRIASSGEVTGLEDSLKRPRIEGRKTDGKWVCEVAISFEALGTGQPGDGAAWKASFGRLYGNPYADTSWVRKRGTDPLAFASDELGELRFSERGPYLKVTSLGNLHESRMRVVGLYFEPVGFGRTKPDPDRLAEYGSNFYNRNGTNRPDITWDKDTSDKDSVKKDIWIDMPLEGHGRILWGGQSVFYKPGEEVPFSALPTSGGGQDDDRLGTSTRPADSVALNVGYGWFDGYRSYYTAPFMKTERLPVGRPFDPLYLYSYVVVPGNKIVFYLETLGLKAEQEGKFSLHMDLLSPTGAVLGSRRIEGARAGEYEVEFDSTPLFIGKNVFRAVLSDEKGQAISKLESIIEKPDSSSCKGNSIGKSDKVPAPFEPVRRQGDTVHIWGREYKFRRGAVVGEIISQKSNVLSSPVVLEASKSGRRIAFGSTGWKCESQDDTQVVMVNTLTSGDIDIKLRNTIEFDGMMRVDFVLQPKQAGTELDTLSLRVPVKAKHAQYMNWSRGQSSFDSRDSGYGPFPESGFKGDFRPFIWLGDDDRGLLWFAEYMKNWSIRDRPNVISVQRDGEEVELRVNMIDHTTRIDKPISITFGLQAGPVKPLPDRWRNFPKDLSFIFASDYAYQDHNPIVVEREAEKIDKLLQEGKRVVLCAYPEHIARGVPAYKFYGSNWRAHGPMVREKGGFDLDQMCPRTGWVDFQLWAEKTALDLNRNRHVGLWYDLSWAHSCLSLEHPDCAYVDDRGEIHPRINIFGLRDYYKRIYTLFRERVKDTYIVAHSSSSNFQLPYYAFVDAIWDGEQYAYRVEDYIKDVPPATWRAEFMGKQFGPVPIFYSVLRYATEDKATYNVATMLYLHDNLYSWGFYNVKILEAFDKVKDEFGVAEPDTKFIPYWEAMNKTFRSVNTDVLVSAYTRPGKALLVVGNLSDKAVDEAVTIDFAKLGVNPRSVQVFDGRTTVDVPVDARSIRLKIDAKSPVLVTAK